MKKFEKVMQEYDSVSAKMMNCGRYSEEYRKFNLELQILRNNARAALAAEVLPVIAEVFQKYGGKQYGPKTKDKITSEIKERTGCLFYLSSHTFDGMKKEAIFSLLKNGYTISCDWDFRVHFIDYANKAFAIDNKIQAFAAEEVYISGLKEYIEDPAERVKDLQNAFAKVKALNEELNKALEEYNNLTVDGIGHRHNSNKFYSIQRRGSFCPSKKERKERK